MMPQGINPNGITYKQLDGNKYMFFCYVGDGLELYHEITVNSQKEIDTITFTDLLTMTNDKKK